MSFEFEALSSVRKSIFITACVAVVLLAGVLYVIFFGEVSPTGSGIFARSPYQELTQTVVKNVAALQTVRVEETVTGDLAQSTMGAVKKFTTNGSLLLSLKKPTTLQLDWQSTIHFIGRSGANYSLVASLKRIAPELFYLKVAQANIAPDIKPLVENLLTRWISVDKAIALQIIPPEERTTEFTEAQFLASLQKTLPLNPPIELTRKISENVYQFTVSPNAAAAFFGALFGDLTQQPFSPDEIALLAQSLQQYTIAGTMTLDPLLQVPRIIDVNWNNNLQIHLVLSDFNEPLTITPPAKATPLEELLQ